MRIISNLLLNVPVAVLITVSNRWNWNKNLDDFHPQFMTTLWIERCALCYR